MNRPDIDAIEKRLENQREWVEAHGGEIEPRAVKDIDTLIAYVRELEADAEIARLARAYVAAHKDFTWRSFFAPANRMNRILDALIVAVEQGQ